MTQSNFDLVYFAALCRLSWALWLNTMSYIETGEKKLWKVETQCSLSFRAEFTTPTFQRSAHKVVSLLVTWFLAAMCRSPGLKLRNRQSGKKKACLLSPEVQSNHTSLVTCWTLSISIYFITWFLVLLQCLFNSTYSDLAVQSSSPSILCSDWRRWQTIIPSSWCAAADGELKQAGDEPQLTRKQRPAAALSGYHGIPVSERRLWHHLHADWIPITAESSGASRCQQLCGFRIIEKEKSSCYVLKKTSCSCFTAHWSCLFELLSVSDKSSRWINLRIFSKYLVLLAS